MGGPPMDPAFERALAGEIVTSEAIRILVLAVTLVVVLALQRRG